MNDFSRCNTISGIYWSKQPIERLKIKVTINLISNIIPLPKLKKYLQQNEMASETIEPYKSTEKTIRWQEKLHSSWENYQNSDNMSEKKILSQEKLLKHDPESRIFTYINEDYFEGLPITTNNNQINQTMLEKIVRSMLKTDKGNGESDKDMINKVLIDSSIGSLFENKLNNPLEEARVMYIMFDGSQFNEELDFLVKKEVVLATIIWDSINHCLLMLPDFNDIQNNPYGLEVIEDSRLTFHYSLQLVSQDANDDIVNTKDELDRLVKKIHKKLQKNNLVHNFIIPPTSITRYFVSLEIVSGRGFDNSHVYVQYELRLPEGFTCEDNIAGRTQLCGGHQEEVHFSYIIDFVLDYQNNSDQVFPQAPKIYFEIISQDWWSVERTEGYCYTSLDLFKPGYQTKELHCILPEENNKILADMRRFFLGGRHLMSDFTLLAIPDGQMNNTLNKFGLHWIPSGTLVLRSNILAQSRKNTSRSMHSADDDHVESQSSDLLFRSVNMVLRQYKRARERLLACKGPGDMN